MSEKEKAVRDNGYSHEEAVGLQEISVTNQQDSFSTIKDVSKPSEWTAAIVLAALTASLASLNFGYNISVMNGPTNVFLECSDSASAGSKYPWWNFPRGESFPLSCYPANLAQMGWIVAAMNIGALISSLVAGGLANRWGRRPIMALLNIPFIVGYALQALSVNPGMLLLGRLLAGMGCGAACIVVPMYLTEISGTSIRGIIASTHQMAIVSGIVLADLAGYVGLAQETYWRFLFVLGLVVSLAQFFGVFLLCPESPVFLAHRLELQRARLSLMKFRGKSFDESEYNKLINASSTRAEASWSFYDLLVRNIRQSFKSVLVAVALLSGQQFSGINVVFYFSSILFSQEGPATQKSTPSIIPVLFSALNCAITIPGVYLVEKLGRRKTLIISTALVVICGCAATLFFTIKSRIGSMIAVLFYVAGFAIGMGPVPWLISNEVFPIYAHAAASSIANLSNWLSSIIVAFSFPYFKQYLGSAIFMPYATLMAGLLVFIITVVPETNGRPMQFI